MKFMGHAAHCRLAGICVGLALATGSAIAEDKTTIASAAARASVANPQSFQVIDEYQIGAQDLIEITVFQVPEMSRTVRVNARGQISLPLVGAVDAGGLTAQELESAIAKQLAAGYLQDPQVSVFIKEYISQRVTVEGMVQKAGVYALTGRTTLLQTIAMASGMDPIANENEVKVFREKAGGARETLIYDVEAIRAGKIEDPQIKGNDLVVVEKSATRSAIKNISDTIRGVVSFGRY